MLFTMIAVSMSCVCLYTQPDAFGNQRETLESTVYGQTDISCHVVTRKSENVDLMYSVSGNIATMHGWFDYTLLYYYPNNPSQQRLTFHNEWVIEIDRTTFEGYFYFPPPNGVTWGSAPIRANYYLRYIDGVDGNNNPITSPYHVYLGYYDFHYNNGSTYVTHSPELYRVYDDNNFFIEADFVLYDDAIYDYDSDYQTAYNNGYNQGQADGYSTGFYDGSRQSQQNAYDTGYNTGHQDGYSEGYYEGTEDGYDSGYLIGKQNGYDDAIDDVAANGGIYTFGNLFGAIADTPILYIRQLLGFDVFGVGAVNILMSMITAVVIIWILRKVF